MYTDLQTTIIIGQVWKRITRCLFGLTCGLSVLQLHHRHLIPDAGDCCTFSTCTSSSELAELSELELKLTRSAYATRLLKAPDLVEDRGLL